MATPSRSRCKDALAKGGWTMVTNQVSPLGTSDFSNYLLNVANSGADIVVNINWGNDRTSRSSRRRSSASCRR